MAYVSPITQIILLQDVPLESDYEHTILFESLTQQENYFKTKQRFIFNQQTYQRVSSNTIRIQKNAEELYYCNYLMFINPEYSVSKWFYCFINEINYINNEVSEIVYEVDVIQTWFFQYALQECMVEREHSNVDTLFSNIVTENLDLGTSYVTNKMTEDSEGTAYPMPGCKRFDMNELGACIMTTTNYMGAEALGPLLANNIYYQCRFIFIPFNYADLSGTAQQIYDTIVRVAGDIINIFQFPSKFYNNVNPFQATPIPFTIHGNFSTYNSNVPSIDGYMPKNKKLFSYPFNFLYVSNNCGQTAEFKWEDWTNAETNQQAEFGVIGALAPTPTIQCIPTDYRKMSVAFDDALTYANFPTNCWDVDTFRLWWQSNRNSWATNQVGSVISTIGQALGGYSHSMAGNIVRAGADYFASQLNMFGRMADLEATPHQVHGQVQTDNFNAVNNKISFDFYRMSIKHKQAKILDDFFSKFGYAVKELKVPDYSPRRPYWYYIKTVGCQIDGVLPNSEKVKICKVYDKGVTFWKCKGTIIEPTVDVGNYNQDNEIDKITPPIPG